MSYIKTDKPGLMRDPVTKAIINTNVTEYEMILEKRKNSKQIQTVQHQIDSLKNEFSDLKGLILQLINGSK